MSTRRTLRTERWWERPLAHFVALTVGGLLLVGIGATWATGRAGHSEALNEARSITESSLRTVIVPYLTMDVLAGDAEAIEEFDREIEEHLLDDSIVRVKLWREDGTVIFSDATQLIGERYEMDTYRFQPIEDSAGIAEHDDLDDPENRFDQDLGPLMEVYVPFEGPDGDTMLFELYFTDASVAQSSSRIRSTVLPIVIASLVTLGLLTLFTASRMQRRLDRSATEREQLLRRSVDASAIERRRIAADLHDGVVQDLSGTLMLMSVAQRHTNGHEEAGKRITQATTGIRHSLRSLRSVALEIHPPNLDEVGLEAALDDLVNTFTDRHNFTIEVSMRSDGTNHKRLIYRFVQEGLRNVAKHANASKVRLILDDQAHEVVVSVIDDGVGPLHGQDESGMGLNLLAELADEVGGVVTLAPSGSGGSSLQMVLPR